MFSNNKRRNQEDLPVNAPENSKSVRLNKLKESYEDLLNQATEIYTYDVNQEAGFYGYKVLGQVGETRLQKAFDVLANNNDDHKLRKIVKELSDSASKLKADRESFLQKVTNYINATGNSAEERTRKITTYLSQREASIANLDRIAEQLIKDLEYYIMEKLTANINDMRLN